MRTHFDSKPQTKPQTIVDQEGLGNAVPSGGLRDAGIDEQSIPARFGGAGLAALSSYVRSLGQGVREARELLTTKIQDFEQNHTLEPHTNEKEANGYNR